MSDQPNFNADAAAQWLTALHDRHDGTGHYSISWLTSTGRMLTKHFAVADGITAAVDHVQQLDGEGIASIYARVTTVTGPPARGRGDSSISYTLPALWADLDIAGPGHKRPTDQGLAPLPADEDQARAIVTESGLPQPTIWIHSGGGLYPIWLIDPVPVIAEHLEQARTLSRTWQNILAEAASRLGVHYGTEVSDLARLLRVPGTVNRKEGLARPCRILSDDGPTYTSRQLRDAATHLAPAPKVTTPPPAAGQQPPRAGGTGGGFDWNSVWPDDGVKPGADFNARATPDGVVDMLTAAGWDVIDEDSSKIYLRRPGKTDPGHSATVDKTTCGLWVFSGEAHPFRAHQDGIDRGERPFSVYAILHHGGDYRAAAQALHRQGYGTKGTHENSTRPASSDAPAPDADADADNTDAIRAAAWRTHDDIGNGQRVVDLYADEVRHIGDEDRWAVWDSSRWAVDMNNAATEIAKKVAESMLSDQVDVLLGTAGEMPPYPDSYPAVHAKGKRRGEPIAPTEWLAGDDGDQAVTWLYASAERAEWFRQWAAWHQQAASATALRKFAKDCRDMGRLKNMMTSAQSTPELRALRTTFDRPGSGVFVTTNLTIDTRTGKTREHRQQDWNTRLCPIKYNPGAAAPQWTKFLERNLPDEPTRRYMQKLAGYAMTGDADQKLLVLLHSDVGDTGKSLFLNVVKETMGSDYATGLAQSTLAPRREGGDGGRDPDRHAMMGKRLLIGSEFRKSEPMDEAFMKRFTGRDPVSTRGNYSKLNVEWMPEGLIIIGTNKLFRIDLDDPAVWSRIIVVPFTVAFPKGHPERDDDLQRKIIDQEKEGVLAWLVEGLRLYRDEGLVPSGEITLATETYRSNSDHVSKWIETAVEDGRIHLTDDATTGSTPSQLWEEFERWQRTERIVTDLKLSSFKARLEELGYPYAKLTSGPFKGKRVMKGIELTAPDTSSWHDSGRSF